MVPSQTVTMAEQVGTDGPIAVEGARTRWDLGGSLDADTRLIAAPAGIIAYQPEEMTVHVYAGTPVRHLHDALAAAGQRCSLPDRGGTVGGALAVGENDLLVRAVGRVRHAALQVRYVAGDGRVITGGGPTVKNVSGFDLPRLMVGSLGTLGLLADVVLRTNPAPPAGYWLAADDVDPFAVNAALYRPAAVLWQRDTHPTNRTWVRLEGHAADVEAQRAELDAFGDFSEQDAAPELPAHRWSLPPSQLRELDVRSMESFVAAVGVGTVFAARPQPPRRPDHATEALAQRLKALFDPQGRLNPGRDACRR